MGICKVKIYVLFSVFLIVFLTVENNFGNEVGIKRHTTATVNTIVSVYNILEFDLKKSSADSITVTGNMYILNLKRN